jgi:hypothetical protein
MKIRPRDLFPESSIVTADPAARPTAIHAMMPITDSLGYRRNDEVTRAAVPLRITKSSGACPAATNFTRARARLRGSGATFLTLLHFPGFLNSARDVRA